MIDTLSLLNVINIVCSSAANLGFQIIGGNIGPQVANSQLLIGLGNCSSFVDLLSYLQIDGLVERETEINY